MSLNVWGTEKTSVGEGFCPDCERPEPHHYDNCPLHRDNLHRDVSRRYLGRYFLPECSCGWRGEATDSPQSALRQVLALHLDYIPMRERG